MLQELELVVVGAGPAGLAAATTAANHGVHVLLIDSAPQPGGQYYKQLPDSFTGDDALTHRQDARELFSRYRQAGGQWLANSMVWGAYSESEAYGSQWLLNIHGPEGIGRIRTRALILSPGAYDRAVAFPGWTLPGVMTAGAVQNLVKSQRVLPGKTIIVAGSGPLILVAAANLVKAGAHVTAVLEASRPLRLVNLQYLPALWGQWSRLREGIGAMRTLGHARVPIRTGWMVTEARGVDGVNEVVMARLSPDWQVVAGTQQSLAADTLVVGYGLIPNTELARMLGCQHTYKPHLGYSVPIRDAHMQTSISGVFSAGDGASIGGAECARVEGTIAGLAAAVYLRRLGDDAARRLFRHEERASQRERRFARMLGNLFTPPMAFYSLANDATIICRCEQVRLGDIREAINAGARSVDEVKGLTRCGMGNCQGRICADLVARMIARVLQNEDYPAVAGTVTARPPLQPLLLSDLAQNADEAGV